MKRRITLIVMFGFLNILLIGVTYSFFKSDSNLFANQDIANFVFEADDDLRVRNNFIGCAGAIGFVTWNQHTIRYVPRICRIICYYIRWFCCYPLIIMVIGYFIDYRSPFCIKCLFTIWAKRDFCYLSGEFLINEPTADASEKGTPII